MVHQPTLAYNDTEREGDLEKFGERWSESDETLNEYESDSHSPILPTEPRPHLDDRAYPSLSKRPADRMVLSFEPDKRRRTTRLVSNGRVMYSYASLSENASSKAGLYTQLRDMHGEVFFFKPWLSDKGLKSFDSADNCYTYHHTGR